MPSPAAWSSPTLDVPSPSPLSSVDDSAAASRSRGSSRSRSQERRVSPRNSNADTQLPPKTAPATLDTNTNTNTNAADHNHLSPTSATTTATVGPPSPSSQPTTPLGSGSWLARMFKKGKKEDSVSPPATAPAAVDDGYRSIFASGQQEYRAEQDVIALNQNILNTSTIHNHEINIDYESMVSGAVVRGHTYGMEELERQHQTQSSMHFDQPIERKLDDDTRLLIYAPAENTPRIYQYPKVEKFVPVNLSDRGTPSPSLSPWLATDVSQATTFQPPSVIRTRGASRDVKNRKILKAVLPTPPLTSQSTVKRAIPDVMPLSTIPSTNTSTTTSPRKSVGFASTTTNTKRTSVVNHRRRASSIDGGMDDHYDEVFDDVFADDEDDYEDVDVSEDHGMEDISDDDDKENQYDENFALAEARAFQVIQQQKIKQERELQQHRQKEYQEATKMWL